MILLVLAGAERRHHEGLRLAAGEQRRAVGARQHADLGHDRADRLEVAAVDAAAGVEDVPAHDLGLELLEDRRQPLLVDGGFAALGASAAITFALAASTASWRSCLSGIA